MRALRAAAGYVGATVCDAREMSDPTSTGSVDVAPALFVAGVCD
jgi:hypothetical protein